MRNRILTLLAFALFAAPAAAQTASINATATVVAPVAVAPGNNLIFGEVAPGFTRSVAPADGNAGTFSITGGGSVEVSLTFTLPTVLDEVGPGTATLPINFGANDAGYAATSAGPLTTFDPASPFSTNLVTGALFVAIGGTVDALAVAYTGN